LSRRRRSEASTAKAIEIDYYHGKFSLIVQRRRCLRLRRAAPEPRGDPREEQRRGCKERIVRRTAQYLVASPSVLAPGMEPRKLKDKFSSSYLIALASRMAQEVGEAQAIAEKAGKRLPTLSTDVEIRLRSPRERETFAEELLEAIARLAAKYHDEMHPDGRTYRVVVGAHPIRRTRRKP
jgi:hypothetical protein